MTGNSRVTSSLFVLMALGCDGKVSSPEKSPLDGKYVVSGTALHFASGVYQGDDSCTAAQGPGLSDDFTYRIRTSGQSLSVEYGDLCTLPARREGNKIIVEDESCEFAEGSFAAAAGGVRFMFDYLAFDLDQMERTQRFRNETADGRVMCTPTLMGRIVQAPEGAATKRPARRWDSRLTYSHGTYITTIAQEPRSVGCGRAFTTLSETSGRIRKALDGRYYLEGFDCYLPGSVTEGRVVCETEPDRPAALPTMIVSRFVMSADRLELAGVFEADSFEYCFSLDATVAQDLVWDPSVSP